MKRILTVITMAILTLTAIGTAEARQQTDSRNSLAGKVSDAATSAPIEFATVALILPDSTFVDGTTTDSTGKFAFSGLTAREYILKISFIGYKDAVIRVNPADGTDIGTVSIEPDSGICKKTCHRAEAGQDSNECLGRRIHRGQQRHGPAA